MSKITTLTEKFEISRPDEINMNTDSYKEYLVTQNTELTII